MWHWLKMLAYDQEFLAQILYDIYSISYWSFFLFQSAELLQLDISTNFKTNCSFTPAVMLNAWLLVCTRTIKCCYADPDTMLCLLFSVSTCCTEKVQSAVLFKHTLQNHSDLLHCVPLRLRCTRVPSIVPVPLVWKGPKTSTCSYSLSLELISL